MVHTYTLKILIGISLSVIFKLKCSSRLFLATVRTEVFSMKSPWSVQLSKRQQKTENPSTPRFDFRLGVVTDD
jgi:hypothetical protein